MSKSVKNAIHDFYLAKKLKGKVFPRTKLRNMFKSCNCHLYTKLHKTSSVVNGKYIDFEESVDYTVTTRDIFLKHFNDRKYFLHTIRGTNLVFIHINLSWWQLEQYGNENGIILYDDIEPENINKNIKDRDDVLLYLQYIKNFYSITQEQLILPGFDI